MGNNTYVNQPQNIGNLHNSNAAQDQRIPTYNAQHNGDNALSVDAQNDLLQSQLETNLPAAAGSPQQHREITIPLSNYRPNLNSRTLAKVPIDANSNAFPIVPQNPTVNFNASVPASVNTVGGTTYYPSPVSSAILDNGASQTALMLPVCPTVSSSLPYYRYPPNMQHPCLPHNSESQQVTVKDLAELLSVGNGSLTEWKLSQYNGDPLQWQEWCGQFRSAIDSQTLTDDVKLIHLKTLVTGKSKAAIEEIAYCCSMYRDAMKTLERKFEQPQAVVTVHLDKLSSYLPSKLHNSVSKLNFATTMSSLLGVFRSLSYDSDLHSSSLLRQAVQKLPPNLNESWSTHNVKKEYLRPTLLDF